jgi:titin
MQKVIVSVLVVGICLYITSGCLARDKDSDSGSSAIPPKPPSALHATVTGIGRVLLTWQDNANDELGFIVERGKQSDVNFLYVTNIPANITSYTDANLSAETTYYYRIKSYNRSGDSAYSNIADVFSPPGPPDRPILLEVRATSFQEISILWLDNSHNEAGFRIERKTTLQGTYNLIATVDANTTSFSDNYLLPETVYYYRIRAFNAFGDSFNSNELSATTLPFPPLAPSNLVASSSTQNVYSVSLQWTRNSTNEDGFKIERRQGSGNWQEIGEAPKNAAGWVDSSVLPDTTYYYRVFGWNQGGYGGFSNVAEITTPSWYPLAPSNLSALAVSSSQINLQWRDNSNNEVEFNIERSTNGISFSEITTVPAETTYYPDRTLSATTTYYYKIRASNAVGNSPYSNIASSSTFSSPASAPLAPAGLTATNIWGDELTIEFRDESSNEEGFTIYRRAENQDNFTQIATIEAFSLTGTTIRWTDRAVSSTTTYYYGVTAYNGKGDSVTIVSTAIATKRAPPAAPSSLLATAILSNQVALTWTNNATDAETFKLERKKAGDEYTQILSLSAYNTSYIDTSNIEPDTTYYYRIRAYNEGGFSTYSNEVPVTTLAGPPKPPILSRLETISATQINIFWSDESHNETGFRVERKTGTDGSWVFITNTPANSTDYADKTVSPNTHYFYKVRAFNAAGNSNWSNVLSATTMPLAPNSPSNLIATAVSSAQVNLFWTDNATNEDGFIIESKRESGNYSQLTILDRNTETFSHLPVSSSTTYSYRVRAYNFIGMSDYSNPASATTFSYATVPPTAASNLTATAFSSYQIVLRWIDNSGIEEGFRIRRKKENEQDFVQIATVPANLESFSDTTLDDLTTYYYEVTAYNIAGEGEPSLPISATTLAVNFSEKYPSDKPSTRWLHSMVWDNERKYILLFGGWDGGDCNDTWMYDGNDWIRLFSNNLPQPRRHHSLAYDEIRKRVVLFGGVQSTTKRNDTLEWDGLDWTEKNPITKPSAREGHSMVYDAQRGKVLLFGGVGDGYFNDTLEWDGTNWVLKTPTTRPSARSAFAMVYNYTRNKVLLFGGYDGSSKKDDTWEWDGANWTLLNPANKPPARTYGRMIYDAVRNEIVLFGGEGASSFLNDTWEWDGTNWTMKNPTNKPSARWGHSMAYDALRKRIVVFGGWKTSERLNDTWEYP